MVYDQRVPPLHHLFRNPVFGLGFVVLEHNNFPFRERVPVASNPGLGISANLPFIQTSNKTTPKI
ncbi:hypothetical protein THOB06_520008 [Vibrio rotiferianus]|nr:hypothetical protein THOG10_520008 [Vibrio rotiferianus]CAH1592315.1 hypothetical protein THOB06_520008 [Vibrio rotiferianus]